MDPHVSNRRRGDPGVQLAVASRRRNAAGQSREEGEVKACLLACLDFDGGQQKNSPGRRLGGGVGLRGRRITLGERTGGRRLRASPVRHRVRGRGPCHTLATRAMDRGGYRTPQHSMYNEKLTKCRKG